MYRGAAYSEGNRLDGYTKHERRTAAEADPKTNLRDCESIQYQPFLLLPSLYLTRQEGGQIRGILGLDKPSGKLGKKYTQRRTTQILG